MADTTALKNRIRAAIKANDNQEITGPVLQQSLLDIVDELDLNPELENEARQRRNGDSTLQQGINTERQARIDADNALGQRIADKINSINASSVAYNHNDSNLDATNVQQAIDEAHKIANSNLSAERQARIDADNALGQRITDKINGINASSVAYNHNDSKLDATNVQQAIDEVYSKGNTNRENDKTELEKSISDNKVAVDASIQDVYKKSNYNDGDNIIDFNTINIIKDNPMWLFLLVDVNDKFIYGITRKDGQPHWGVGIPKVVKDYVDKQINDILGTNNITETIDSLKEVEKFLADFKNSDTLKALLDTKANKTDVDNSITNTNADIADKYKKSNPNDDNNNITNTNEILHISSGDDKAIILIDAFEKVLAYWGIKGFNGSALPFNIQGIEIKAVQSSPFIFIVVDKDYKPFIWVKRDGTFDFAKGVPSTIKAWTESWVKDYVEQEINNIDTPVVENGVVERNADKLPILYNSCRSNKYQYASLKKDFQLEIITDTHDSPLSLQNAVKVANNFQTIDAIIHCGDIARATFNGDKAYISARMEDLQGSKKPYFFVLGNHDVGQTSVVYFAPTKKSAYNIFIKPIIDANVLKSGEYNEDKCYYYHDFTDNTLRKKIRLIVLDEFDTPTDLLDNEYWEAVDYNASYPQIEAKEYVYSEENDIFANIGDYEEKSFKLKKTVTVNLNFNFTDKNDTLPHYRNFQGARMIGKEQAEWFVNTLNSTPEGYGIIIALHQAFSQNSTNQGSLDFANPTEYSGHDGVQDAMNTDFFADIAKAYNNKSSIIERVITKNFGYGRDSSYLNTNDDGDGTKYYYKVSADFTNAKASILGFVGGHVHMDSIFKNDEGFYGINPICGCSWPIREDSTNTHNDVARPNSDSLAFDAITITSWSDGRIALARIGNTSTIDGEKREYEIINTK